MLRHFIWFSALLYISFRFVLFNIRTFHPSSFAKQWSYSNMRLMGVIRGGCPRDWNLYEKIFLIPPKNRKYMRKKIRTPPLSRSRTPPPLEKFLCTPLTWVYNNWRFQFSALKSFDWNFIILFFNNFVSAFYLSELSLSKNSGTQETARKSYQFHFT